MKQRLNDRLFQRIQEIETKRMKEEQAMAKSGKMTKAQKQKAELEKLNQRTSSTIKKGVI